MVYQRVSKASGADYWEGAGRFAGQDVEYFVDGEESGPTEVQRALCDVLEQNWAAIEPRLANYLEQNATEEEFGGRNALVYVLQNARKHGARILGIDAHSSGPWFSGWHDRTPRKDRALPEASSWLLLFGWLKRGRIATSEAPRPDPDARGRAVCRA